MSRIIKQREQGFKESLEKFMKSDKNTDDFMEIFIHFRSVSLQGSGVGYDRIKEIVEEVVSKK